MSKYLRDGKPVPYHFIDYADPESTYHKHVDDLVLQIGKAMSDAPERRAWRLHEVGCGEGLILYQMWRQGPDGLMVSFDGNDADPGAVRMAQLLMPGFIRVVLEDNITLQPSDPGPDVVLFCDCLEHMKTWREHLRWAWRTARIVVIAVPSQPDRHAIHGFEDGVFGTLFDDGWRLVHGATRHARHLSIYRREP